MYSKKQLAHWAIHDYMKTLETIDRNQCTWLTFDRKLYSVGQPSKRAIFRKFNTTSNITDFQCRISMLGPSLFGKLMLWWNSMIQFRGCHRHPMLFFMFCGQIWKVRFWKKNNIGCLWQHLNWTTELHHNIKFPNGDGPSVLLSSNWVPGQPTIVWKDGMNHGKSFWECDA